MDNQRTAAVLMFIAMLAFTTIGVVNHLRPSFTLNDGSYVQVGVMKIDDNGNVLYAPVFKRIK